MIHIRIVAPPALATTVVELLTASPSVLNVVHLPGAATKPPGDVVLCDVAREDASIIVGKLVDLGIPEHGSVAVLDAGTQISALAERAEQAAVGSPADAVVWEEVEAQTSQSATLSVSFVAFMVIATLLAAVAIMIDSQVLLIGAMVVSPDFGPLAGICVAVVERRLSLARRSLAALAVGFGVGIAAALALTLVLRALDVAPETVAAASRPATYFIADPDIFTIIVAVLAGIAGVLSLTTPQSGALTGVLISVTTIPAAANVGVAAAYGDWSEVRGAAAQLGINLVCLTVAGVATLGLQRRAYRRRRAAA